MPASVRVRLKTFRVSILAFSVGHTKLKGNAVRFAVLSDHGVVVFGAVVTSEHLDVSSSAVVQFLVQFAEVLE